MAKFDIANAAPGARGIVGFIVEAGAIAEGVELSDDDALALGEMDGVTVTEAKDKPVKDKPKPE